MSVLDKIMPGAIVRQAQQQQRERSESNKRNDAKFDHLQVLWCPQEQDYFDDIDWDDNVVSNMGAYDITHAVTGIKHDIMLQRPWEHFTMTVVLQHGMANRRCPVAGSWIIVKSKDGRYPGDQQKTAIFFGFIKDVTENGIISDSGVSDSFSVNITAVSWLEAMASNQVVIALTAKGSVGTFFTASPSQLVARFSKTNVKVENAKWDKLIESVLAAVDPSNPTALGDSLTKLWQIMGAVRVPGKLVRSFVADFILFGGRLGDLVPVVYDDFTRKRFAPRLTIDPVPGWGLEGLKTMVPNGQNTVDLLMGTFQADINLVEMYPTLEPFDGTINPGGTITESPETVWDSSNKVVVDADDVGADEAGVIQPTSEEEEFKITSGGGPVGGGEPEAGIFEKVKSTIQNILEDSRTTQNAPATLLGAVLGVNPVIVYRMKPFRTETLTDYRDSPYSPINQTGVRNTFNGKDVGGTSEYKPVSDKFFVGTTWALTDEKNKLLHGFEYTQEDISGWTGTYTEHDHINSVSVNIPGEADSATQWLYEAGLPIQYKYSIDRYGLRHMSPRWPFFPPMEADKDKDSPEFGADLMTSLYTIALQTAQFMIAGDRFLRGTVKLNKMHAELRPGMVVRADISKFIARPDGNPAILTAYVDTVNHQVITNNESVYAMTTIGYSRGLVDESVRNIQVPFRRVPNVEFVK